MKAMFRRLSAVFALLLTVAACTAVKPKLLKPIEPGRADAVMKECLRPFLPVKYRLLHAIEAEMPDGAKWTAVGALVADPRTRHFRTVLMTIEGLVLFDAEAGETLAVHRALPPFDSPSFAKGLAEDIRLAFFAPDGKPTACGKTEGGASVCRFARADGRIVEVETLEGVSVEIRLYGSGQSVRKRVTMAPPKKPGLADMLEIRGGWPPYALRLRLLESEAMDGGPGTESAAVPAAAGSPGAGGAAKRNKRVQ